MGVEAKRHGQPSHADRWEQTQSALGQESGSESEHAHDDRRRSRRKQSRVVSDWGVGADEAEDEDASDAAGGRQRMEGAQLSQSSEVQGSVTTGSMRRGRALQADVRGRFDASQNGREPKVVEHDQPLPPQPQHRPLEHDDQGQDHWQDHHHHGRGRDQVHAEGRDWDLDQGWSGRTAASQSRNTAGSDRAGHSIGARPANVDRHVNTGSPRNGAHLQSVTEHRSVGGNPASRSSHSMLQRHVLGQQDGMLHAAVNRAASNGSGPGRLGEKPTYPRERQHAGVGERGYDADHVLDSEIKIDLKHRDAPSQAMGDRVGGDGHGLRRSRKPAEPRKWETGEEVGVLTSDNADTQLQPAQVR